MANIEIGGRLHSTATGNVVTGANEVLDDIQNKKQQEINAELIEAVGTGGSVDTRITNAINALDSTASQSAGNDGLALSVTETDGKITAVSGSIAANTYDTYGSASAAQSAAESTAAADATSKVNAAKTELLGDAATDYNTLGKLEDKIQAEATARENADTAIDGRVDDLEEAVGSGGSVDERIADAVENAAYLGSNDGSAVIADFDPQSDTVWKKAQVLSAAEKEQIQQNIGVKEWLNNLTGEKFASYTATSQTASVTSILPATGATDTIYRVGKWDGSAYNEEYYSDYAWDGSVYVQLNKKSIVGEVFDISEYNAGAKYADLAAALGTNGENIPQNVRKGGMSVKYVNTDNKYVQYFLPQNEWSIDPNDWEKMNLEEEVRQLDQEIYGDRGIITINQTIPIGTTYFDLQDAIVLKPGDILSYRNLGARLYIRLWDENTQSHFVQKTTGDGYYESYINNTNANIVLSKVGIYSDNAISVDTQIVLFTNLGIYERLQSIIEEMPNKANVIQLSVNLFCKDSILNKNGFYNVAGLNQNASLVVTHPIFVKKGVTYKCLHDTSQLGSNNFIAEVDYGNNIISIFTGVISNGYMTFVTNRDCYISLNVGSLMNTFMICESSLYPNDYVPYQKIFSPDVTIPETNANPLFGKKISLTGDSICAGAGFAGGYGKIIAERNSMIYENIAGSGGTIVETSPRFCISESIANMASDADYVILEGGVNDAALNTPLGAISFRFDATLDTTTFYGAFESMLKSALLRFPTAKIGYIIPHFMVRGFQWWSGDNYMIENQDNYRYAVITCCKKYGIPLLDLSIEIPQLDTLFNSTSMHDYAAQFTADGWHPNELGYKTFYCDKIEAWMKTL